MSPARFNLDLPLAMPMELVEVRPSVDEIYKCRYSAWYGVFRENVCQSVIINPVPESFVHYLNADTIKLSDSHHPVANTSDNEYSDWDESADEEESANATQVTAAFADMHEQVIATIRDLGPVSPKMNWLAPKDAKWMLPNHELKCYNADDVYLVLKASDHIAHDLDYAYEQTKTDHKPANYELVLRQWMTINPALEFRVFVCDGKIVGVSQRDLNYYDYLAKLQPQIRLQIDTFFTHSFLAANYGLENCILDIYVPRPFNRVWLVDINPFSRASDPLLFTWPELVARDASRDEYDLRLLLENNVGRFATKEHSENQVPLDVIGAASDTAAMIELAQAWK